MTGSLKAVNEALKDTIGFDMTDVMKSQTLEARTTRNIRVDGLPQPPVEPAAPEADTKATEE